MSTTCDEQSASPQRIPLSEPVLAGNEWEYVKSCLDTNWVSSAGEFVDRFEQAVAEKVGRKYAVATASGTAALHTALLLAGVQPGDEVLVSTLTFIASANAIRYCGAHPVFIDAEPRYWQMDTALVADFVENDCLRRDDQLFNKSTGRRVAAIMPVHILGHPVDMSPLLVLAAAHDIPIIEDAAESLGGRYKDRFIASFGDFSCVSFNGNKTITAGAGGMLLTDDQQAAERARYLTTQAKDSALEYVHHEIGFNYRMSNVLAAIGYGQLELLDSYVDSKRRIAGRYQEAFASDEGVGVFSEAGEVYCTYWLSAIILDSDRGDLDRTALCNHLRGELIESRPLWQPLHRSPAHEGAEAKLSGVADRLFRSCLCLPSTPNLSDTQQQRVIDVVHRFQASLPRVA